MHNKKRISLAALLAIMAFAVVPTAAQALESNKSPVHWQKNGVKTAAGEAIPVISWGTAKLTSAAGVIACKNAAASNNTNTAGGESLSEVVLFVTFECAASGGECTPPAEEKATAANLGLANNPEAWPSVLQEEGPVNEGKFRSIDKSEGGVGEHPIEVNIDCFAGGERVGNILFKSGPLPALKVTGSSTPLVLNGTSATKPSETSFEDPAKETGHLYSAIEAELAKEETMEPTVKTTQFSNVLKDEGKTWQTAVPGAPKAGCRVKSEALFPNEVVAHLGNGAKENETTELTLENKVNPSKNFGLATGNFATKFNCGVLTTVPLQGTTNGKFKFIGYLDNGLTPLVTVGRSNAP